MNKVQTAKLYMFNAVVSFLDSHPDDISSMTVLISTFAQFKTAVTRINEILKLKAKLTAGLAAGKNDLREGLIEKAASFARKISSYGKMIENPILEVSGNYSLLQLKTLRDEELGPVCMNIASAAAPIINQLDPCDLSQEDIASFIHDTQDYASWIPLARSAIKQRAIYISTVRDLFKTAENTLRKHIDTQMHFFKSNDPTFYTSYRLNRMIIDLANSPAKISGVIVDAVTQLLIGSATITVLDTNISVIAEHYGAYDIKMVPPGTYSLRVDKEGYKSEIIPNVVARPGKTAKAFARLKLL